MARLAARATGTGDLMTNSAQTAPALKRLWTVKDVADFTGLSVRWVHERTRRGEIPCYRLGTALRFDPEEIRAWIGKFHHSSGGG